MKLYYGVDGLVNVSFITISVFNLHLPRKIKELLTRWFLFESFPLYDKVVENCSPWQMFHGLAVFCFLPVTEARNFRLLQEEVVLQLWDYNSE